MTPESTQPSRFGRYELRSVLGQGGMGVVYEAILVGLVGFRKRVALKVLRPDDEEALATRAAALQREARVGAMLSHPNVVAILDLGREQDQWYIAMELVDGAPVSALHRGGLLDPASIVEIGLATCAGLAHIHDLRVEGLPGGLVHRDIKPQNLLVDRHGTLKIADFGITALTAAASDRGGSPAWMAPEQQAGIVTGQADLFSLGAVLYALAARRTPFGTGTVALRESRRVEELLQTPAFLRPVDQAVPGLGRIVGRCLRLRPEDRYPTVQALASELRVLRSEVGWGDLGACVERSRSLGPPGSEVTEPPRVATHSARTHTPGGGLIGRTEELAQLHRHFAAGALLVTVTGPGGGGKSHLAREFAAQATQPVAWAAVGAVEAGDTLGVVRAVANALAVDLTHGDPGTQVLHVLADRSDLLLVLDEADACADVLGPWLDQLGRASPRTAVLVTARAPVRAFGERVVPLPPMSAEDGVALFTRRATGTLAASDFAALPQLVEALDGLPLAIELAAARARTLRVPQLLERMRDRFRLLVDPQRPGTTLRSTLATSFALLRPWESRALGELACFAGGFTLDAAEGVLKLDAWPEAPWALDVVSGLLDASLLHHDRDRNRFFLGNSVQQYALETLEPAVRRAAELRHGDFFSQLGAEVAERDRSSHLLQLEDELDNLRVAAERAVARGDARVAERTAFAAASVYTARGPYAAGSALLDAVLALPEVEGRPRLLLVRWGLLRGEGRGREAAGHLEEAQRLAEQSGDRARVLQIRALRMTETRDRQAAVSELRDVAETARALGESVAEGRALSILGLRLQELGELGPARVALDRALAALRGAGEPRGVALATLRLGRLDQQVGDFAAAAHRFEEAERYFVEHRDDGNTATTRENLAVLETDLGNFDGARVLFEQVLAHARTIGARRMEANVLANLGELELLVGRPQHARARYEQARVVESTGGLGFLQARLLGSVAALEHHLGHSARADAAWGEAIHQLTLLGLPAVAAEHEAARQVARVGAGADPEPARALLRTLEAAGSPEPWIELGHLSLDRGDEDAASEVVGDLQERWTSRLVPLHRASLEVLGARLALRRGAADVGPRLARAYAELHGDSRRARWWIARVELGAATGEPLAPLLESLGGCLDRAAFGPGTPIRRSAERLTPT